MKTVRCKEWKWAGDLNKYIYLPRKMTGLVQRGKGAGWRWWGGGGGLSWSIAPGLGLCKLHVVHWNMNRGLPPSFSTMFFLCVLWVLTSTPWHVLRPFRWKWTYCAFFLTEREREKGGTLACHGTLSLVNGRKRSGYSWKVGMYFFWWYFPCCPTSVGKTWTLPGCTNPQRTNKGLYTA